VEKGRRRRSQAEAGQLVAEFEASGISREEYCQRQGLALATLARYRRRLRQRRGEGADASRWLAVELSGPTATVGSGVASGLRVALPNGLRIEIDRGFDAPTLGQLLSLPEPA